MQALASSIAAVRGVADAAVVSGAESLEAVGVVFALCDLLCVAATTVLLIVDLVSSSLFAGVFLVCRSCCYCVRALVSQA